MAAKRKYRKGLATEIVCVLGREGAASTEYLVRRTGYAYGTVSHTLDRLEDRKIIRQAGVMTGKNEITMKGASIAARRCQGRGR
jgi:DNA-binding transcriptional ArsR family regulator